MEPYGPGAFGGAGDACYLLATVMPHGKLVPLAPPAGRRYGAGPQSASCLNGFAVQTPGEVQQESSVEAIAVFPINFRSEYSCNRRVR